MPVPERKSFPTLYATGLLLCLGVVQITLAEADELAVTQQQAPVSVAEAETMGMTGQQVYSNVCIACHTPPGVGGAPAFGDAAAWAPRIAKGMDTLVDHALNGFSGQTGVMPRKGERLDLTDAEVIRAVEYMVGEVAR